MSIPLLLTVSRSAVPCPNYTIQTASVYQRGIWIPLKPNYSTLRHMKTSITKQHTVSLKTHHKSILLSGHTGRVTSLLLPLYLRVPQKKMHGLTPTNLIKNFKVLMKCRSKHDCLIYEMLWIKNKGPKLNTQTDSIRAKLFT